MKDGNQLFGIAAIILACGFLVRSFQPAHAEIGPSVNMGSNPLVSKAGSGGNSNLFTVPSDRILVLTDFDISYYGNSYTPVILSGDDGVTYGKWVASGGGYPHTAPSSKRSGIPIPAGVTLSINTSNETYYTISGYYSRP